jgi:pyruvate/2-oxoglutarate dehydrogenase complex dihydrolipoamide acyltransferase (E2) component
MKKTILMPQLGESLAEGTILRWLKQPGEHIDRDEAIVEISTDKVNAEVPSSAGGIISRLLVAEGDVVGIGQPIAEIDGAELVVAAEPDHTQGHPAGSPHASTRPANQNIFVSPIVRKLLEQHSIDISQVQGSGIGGRVTKDDVLAYIERRSAGEATVAQQSSLSRPQMDVGADAIRLLGEGLKPAAEPARNPDSISGQHIPAPPPSPLTPLRRTIASHLSRAHQ